MTEKENYEFKSYEFMETKEHDECKNRKEEIEYFLKVKMTILNKLDATRTEIVYNKQEIETEKANQLLTTDYKDLYGKDNENIRKAHFRKYNEDKLQKADRLTNQKKQLKNQIDIINNILEYLMQLEQEQ